MAESAANLDYSVGDYVVYPAHGVGRIESLIEHTVSGITVQLYAISFEKERMTLKVPVSKVRTSGLRKLSSKDRFKGAMETLKGPGKVKRTMWSRRAQEYEAKINSGDPVAVAEVVRDLFRPAEAPEQSYSERQIYQQALERLARELAAVDSCDEAKAIERIEVVLNKNHKVAA